MKVVQREPVQDCSGQRRRHCVVNSHHGHWGNHPIDETSNRYPLQRTPWSTAGTATPLQASSNPSPDPLILRGSPTIEFHLSSHYHYFRCTSIHTVGKSRLLLPNTNSTVWLVSLQQESHRAWTSSYLTWRCWEGFVSTLGGTKWCSA